jgi:hypothetical protein
MRTMLKNVSDEIGDCYKQAEACAQHAAAQTDPKLRHDFLALEAAWLKLARLRERDLSDRIPDYRGAGNCLGRIIKRCPLSLRCRCGMMRSQVGDRCSASRRFSTPP